MSSPILAAGWEYWRTHRQFLVMTLLIVNLLGGALLYSMRLAGIGDSEIELINLSFLMTAFNLLMACISIFITQMNTARRFTLPVTNVQLMLLAQVPLLVTSAVLTLFSHGLIHLAGPFQPRWEAALIVSVFAGFVQATAWFTRGSPWLIPALVANGLWMLPCIAQRYHLSHGTAIPPVQQLTDLEYAGLAALLAVSFPLMANGIARARRQQPLPATGLLALLVRWVETYWYSERSFRSAGDAQFWYESRSKGIAIPIVTSFFLALGLLGGWLDGHPPGVMVEKLLTVSPFLALLVGMLGGIVHGNLGWVNQKFAMSVFYATRPMATRQLSRIILLSGLQGLAVSFLIWGLVVVVLLGAGMVRGRPAPESAFLLHHWVFFTAFTAICGWTGLTLMMLLVATGRSWITGLMSIGTSGLTIAIMAVYAFLLNEQQGKVLELMISGTLCAASVLALFFSLWVGLRSQFISAAVVVGILALWVLLFTVVERSIPAHGLNLRMLLVGATALPFWPVLLLPTAVAWNRSR